MLMAPWDISVLVESLLAPIKLYRPTVSVLPVALSRRNEYSAVALWKSQSQSRTAESATGIYPDESLR